MANTGGMQFKGGTYKGQVVIDANQALTAMHNLDAALAKVGTTLANMARGRDVSALWNEEAASIENVTRALNEFNRSQNSIGSAEGLMKALNAFSAWHPDMSMTDIFSKLGDGADALITKAKTMASSLDSAFSIPSLRDAFEAFNALKSAGVDMEDIFSKLRQGDLSGLSEQVDTLQRSLSRANIEIRDLESQLDSVKSGEAFAEMQQRIAELENGIEMAKEEFRSFLQMNGFTGWDLNDDGRFSDYFQQIADGTMTATQAITEFKQQYSYMFSEMSGNELAAVLSELERITTAIEGMRNEITQMGASGSMAEMRVSLQEGAEAAKEQSVQLQQMTANASALDALITALTRLADASIESGEGAKTASTAVSELIGAVTGLGQTNIDSLTQLAEILKSLARMENVSVGKASMQNLVSALEALSKIPNMQSLTGLSTVDLRNFNDLHISKAALNNLATFLPTIATVDVASLQKLAAINWGNLSNLSINKSAVSNLKDLATVMSGKPMSIEGMKVSIDESSLSSLSKAIEDSIQRASQNIKLTINNVELSAAAKAVIADEVAKAASSGGSGSGSGGSRGTGDIDAKKKALNELIALYEKYYDLESKKIASVNRGEIDNADMYRARAAAIWDEIAAIEKENPALAENAGAHERVTAAVRNWQAAVNSGQAKSDSTMAKQIQFETSALNEYKKQLDSLGLDKSGIKFGGDASAVERYSAELSELKVKFDAVGAASEANRGTAVAAFEAQRQKVAELRNELNNAAEAAKNQAQAAKLADKIDLWALKNPNAYKDAKDQVDQWLTTLRSQAPLAASQIAEISNEFSRVSAQEKLAGNNGQSFFQTLKAGWAKFGGWSIVSRSFMSVIRIFKQAVTAVKEVDAAMTELRKVTDLTAEGYSRFYEQATKMAGEVGAKLSDVINSTADFARLGYDIADATELSRAAMTYMNVGDSIESVAEATESVISTMKAFKIEASDAMSIVDKFNEVGNNFAISSAGIGEALQRSAAALAAAGNTIDESIGLIVAANDIVQNPESVGTAMKTLTMYIRAAKTEAESAGIETDGMAESVAKLREQLLQLTGGKLDIQIDEKNFKSSFQILKELSEIWDEIGEKSGDVTQANILNLLGGKRNANVLASIISNFQDAIDAAETAGDSMGSAWAENEKYLNSVEGKTKQVEAAFQTFANSVIQSDVVKAFLDIQKAILNIATGLNQVNALIPAIATIATIIKTIRDAITAQKATSTIVSMIVGGNGDITSAIAQLTSLTNAQRALVANNLQTAVSTGAVTGATAAGATSVAGYATAMVGATGASLGFRGALEAIKTAFMSNPIGIALLAITAGIALITKGIQSMKEAAEEAIKQADEIQEAYDTANKTYDQNIESLEKLRSRFEELNKKVGENGTQGALTNDEYKEYLDIVKQIISISPGLSEHYTNVGEAIQGGYTNALKEAIDYQKELLKYENDTYLASGQTLFDGFAEKYRKIRDNMANLNADLYTSIDDILWEKFDDSDKIIASLDKVRELFKMSSGEALWDTKPTLANLEEMLGYYENMEDMLRDLKSMTTEATDSAGNVIQVPLFTDAELGEIRMAMRGYAESAKEFAAVKQDAFDYLYKYFQTDLNDMYDQIPLDRIGEFKTLMEDAMVPTATLEWNKKNLKTFANAYITALGDIETALKSGDIDGSWDKLSYKFQNFPSLLKMIQDALYGVEEAQNETSGSAEEMSKSYEDMAESLSNVDKAISFLTNVNDAGNKNIIDLMKQAQEFATLMNEAGGDVMLDNLFEVGEDGQIIWLNDKIKDLTENYIRLTFANTDLAKESPEAIDKIVEQALAMVDASKEADTLKTSLDAVGNAFDYINDVSEYKAGEKNLFDMIESAYKYAADHEGVNITDLIKWDDSKKSVEFVDLTEEAINSMIDSLAAELGIGSEHLEEFRTSVKNAFADVTEEADALKGAFDAVGDAFDYIKDVASYQSGEKALFDMLKSAYDYAKNNQDVNIADLIKWDDSKKTVEFVDLTEASVNAMIDTLATELGIGTEHLEEFRTAIRASFEDAANEANTLRTALTNVSDAFGYIKELSSYKKGETSLFDMLESAYEYAENHEGVNLSDLIKWDGSNKSVEFIDLTEASINSMIDTLAAQLNIGIDDLEAFRTAVKTAFEDAKEETDTLKDSLDHISDAFSYMKDIAAFRSGEKTLFDTIESAYEYAKNTEGVDISDLIKWDDNGKTVQFIDLTEAKINEMIDSLATELGIGAENLESFRAAVKASFEEIDKDADTVKDAFTAVSDAMAYMQNLASYREGKNNLFAMLEEAYDYAKGHEGVDLSDLIKWDGSTKSVQFIDLAEASIDSMIDTLATELNIGVDDLESFRAAVKNAFEDVKEEADTVKDAFTAISDAFSYMNDLASYSKNEKNLFDMLESAYDYAKNHEGVNLSDLISWDGDNKTVQFADLAEASVDAMIDTLATELNIGIDDLESFRAAVKNVFQGVSEDAEKLTDVFSAIKQGYDFISDTASFGKGETSFFDMLESAYNLADTYKDHGLTLDQILQWDETGVSFKTDILSTQIDALTDKLAQDLGVSEENMEKFRQAVKDSFGEAAEEIDDVSDALSNAKNLNSFLKDLGAENQDPLSLLSSAVNLAEELGMKLEDIVKIDSMGNLTFDANALTQKFNAYIDELVTAGQLSAELAANIKEAAVAEEELATNAKSASERMSDALSSMSSVAGNLKNALSGDTDILSMLSSAADMADAWNEAFGAEFEKRKDTFDFVLFDDNAYKENETALRDMYSKLANEYIDNYIDMRKEAIEKARQSKEITAEDADDELASLNAVREELIAKLIPAFDEYIAQLERANELSKTADVSSTISNVYDYINAVNSGTMTFTEAFEKALTLMEKMPDATLDDFFTINADGTIEYTNGLKTLASWLQTYIQEEVQAGHISQTQADALIAEAQAATKAASAYEQLSNAIGTVNNVSSYLTNAKAANGGTGEQSFVDMLQSAVSLLEQMGEGYTLEDFFSFDPEGNIQYETTALLDWSDKMIDNLVEQNRLSAEFAAQLKLAARAEQQASTTAQRIAKSYEGVTGRVSAASGLTNGAQLTYAEYNAMIEVNPAYAESIEYVNGVLTVNRNKYNEITAAMAEETAQMALLEAAQRKLKYEKLENELKTRKDLTDDVRASMQKEIDKLKLEAKGYMVLANEISNATNQFERFKAASGNSDADTYMDAQSALKMINDVMYNTESELYGRYGNAKFQEAIKLLVNPEIDFNDPAWMQQVQEAKERLERYFGEGTEKNPQTSRSNMGSFWKDLLAGGFATVTVDEAGKQWGQLNGTVEDIAKSFGLTKDAARAALQELQMFSGVNFDWEHIDPEYYQEVIAKAEELARIAEEAQAKAEASKKEAEEARSKADDAAAKLEEAKKSGDDQAVERAEAEAQVADQKAQEAEAAAKEAQEAADKAAASAAEQESTSTDALKKSLEEILAQIEELQSTPIELDFTSAIESSTAVVEQMTSMVEMLARMTEINQSIALIGETTGTTQAGIDELSASVVDVDEEPAVQSLESVQTATESAQRAVIDLSSMYLSLNPNPALESIQSVINALAVLAQSINNINSMTISPKSSSPSGGGASGGVSSAGGTMSAPGGRTLVGELGREIVVDVDTGRWYTVGNNGPEFVNLPRHAIVFNHTKTAELLGDKMLDMRGVSMASGTKGNSRVGGGMINLDAFTETQKEESKKTRQTVEEVAETLEDKLDAIKEAYELANKTLEHLIQHEEFSYYKAERGANYDKMHTYLANEVEIYKSIMANSQKGIEELKRAGADDGSEQLQELEEAYWSAYRSMYEVLDNIRNLYTDALSEEVDSIQSAFKNLTDAAKEYNATGRISIDTFQQLLEGGVEYLGLLKNENGEFDVSKNSIRNLLKLRKDQLAVETAIAYVSRLQEALRNGEAQKVNELVGATGQIGRNTWSIVYANLEVARSMGLTNEQYQAALKNIQNLQALAAVAMDDFDSDNKIAEAKENFEALRKEIEHYIKHQDFSFTVGERALNFTAMNQALNNEVNYYKRIMTEAQATISEMIAHGATDTDENLQAVEEAYWSAYKSMYDTIDKINALRVDALSDRLNGLTGAFNNLKKASEEYNQAGGISLSTFQTLLSQGFEYMSLLDEENGKYVIAKERISQYVEARKNQLAIESALSYIAQVREALENKEEDRLQKLLKVQDMVSNSTWSMVYAQAALLRTSGLTNEQYETLVANLKKMQALADSVVDVIASGEEDISEEYEKQQEAMQSILEYTEDLIRAETNDQIDAIREQIDAYKEIIDLKKKSIDETKKETEYQDSVAEKVKAIAELQAKADMLGLDTSRNAQVERQKILNEIAEKQKDLAKYQGDYAIDAQKEALDKEYEDYEKSRQDEIEALEKSISSEEKVYQLAIARIRDQWETLYQDLIAWNTEEGSVINQEITDAWEAATRAVQKYGSAISALDNLIGNKDDNYIVADIPKYHSGGQVGSEGSVNDHEVLAVLEKGELVINKPMKKALYTVIDFVKELGDKLGASVSKLRNFSAAGIAGQMTPAFAAANTAPVTQNNNITFSPNISVAFNGVDINGRDATSFGRDVADAAADNLFEAFNKRGINAIRTLRQ